MATQGTPLGGLSELAIRVYQLGAAFTLVAYTNPGNSLGPNTVAADLAQPPLANGYSPILMNGQWTVVNGVATYVHPGGGDPNWLASAPWGVTVIGVSMVFGATCVHFRDNVNPFIALAGKRLTVNISNLVGP